MSTTVQTTTITTPLAATAHSPLTLNVYGRMLVPELKVYLQQNTPELDAHYSWTVEQIQTFTMTNWIDCVLKVFLPDSRTSYRTDHQYISIENEDGNSLYHIRTLNLPKKSTEEYTRSLSRILNSAWILLSQLSIHTSLNGNMFKHSQDHPTAIVDGTDCYEGFVSEHDWVHVYTSKEDGSIHYSQPLKYRYSVRAQCLSMMVRHRWRFARKVNTYNCLRDHFRDYGEWCDEVENAVIQDLLSIMNRYHSI